MPLILIPFGKGTGKFWIIGIIVITIIFLIYIGYEDLALKIQNGQVVNPIVLFIAWIAYPLYILMVWFINFMGKWGVLALIPIIIIAVILTNIYSAIIKFIRKRKK
jgi:peptidoglycan/LPS O-acetylase OafA/YrhL